MAAPDDLQSQIAEYNEVISNLSDARTLEDRDWLAWALDSRGDVLRKLGRAKEALASYEQIVVKFDHAPEPELQLRVAIAIEGSAYALLDLKRPEDALGVCDRMLSRFTARADARLAPTISTVLLLRASALWALGRHREEAEAYQRYVYEFSPTSFALFGLARALSHLGRHEEALAAIDQYLTVVTETSESVEPWRLAYLMLAKARHLIILGKLPEALASCDEVIDLLRGAEERDLREFLAGAMVRSAAILALDSRTAEVEEAMAELEDLRQEGDDPLLIPFDPDELESLKQGLARLSHDSEADADQAGLLMLEGEGGTWGIEVVDFRDIPDDTRDLD